MDGHFVPNIVMGAPIIGSVNKSVPGIFMDCHMMVSEPLKVCLSHSPAVDQIYRGGRWQVLHVPPGSDGRSFGSHSSDQGIGHACIYRHKPWHTSYRNLRRGGARCRYDSRHDRVAWRRRPKIYCRMHAQGGRTTRTIPRSRCGSRRRRCPQDHPCVCRRWRQCHCGGHRCVS